MQKPTKPPVDESMQCPNCGSANVVLDETAEVIETAKHARLKQFNCGDCKAHFIPAMTESVSTPISKWGKKVRTSEGLNEERSWAKEKMHYIIILPKKEEK